LVFLLLIHNPQASIKKSFKIENFFSSQVEVEVEVEGKKSDSP